MNDDPVMANWQSGVARREVPRNEKQLSQPFYLHIDEEHETGGTVEDTSFFQVEGRQGAWWLISVMGSILLLMLTHCILADFQSPTPRTVRITYPRFPIVPKSIDFFSSYHF